jgi:uncharacterized membrane protein
MEALSDVSLFAALLTTGLMAGIYLAFTISVLPGIGRTEDATFVAAMRGMNAAILNPVFGLVFGGPLLLGGVALGTRVSDRDQPGLAWVATAFVLYVVTLVITGVVNVPLNNRLDVTEPPDAARALFERGWVGWNVVRTLVCTASFAAWAAALLS